MCIPKNNVDELTDVIFKVEDMFKFSCCLFMTVVAYKRSKLTSWAW